MTTEIMETASVDQEQLERARDQLKYHQIDRLAVLGGSAAEGLARDLGVMEVEVHGTYAAVLNASKERRVGSVIPWQTIGGEPIYHDEKRQTRNIQAILKAGRAMIASVEHYDEESILLTKIVIAA
jgi:hypothetical protein